MLSKLTGHAGIIVETGKKSKLAWFVYRDGTSRFVKKDTAFYIYKESELKKEVDIIVTASGISQQNRYTLERLILKTKPQGKSHIINI